MDLSELGVFRSRKTPLVKGLINTHYHQLVAWYNATQFASLEERSQIAQDNLVVIRTIARCALWSTLARSRGPLSTRALCNLLS